jgi:hypothetical protein
MARNDKQVNQVFISYRREDSEGITGRIYDRLVQQYGKEAIFKDVDSIPLGINFRQHLDSAVSECEIVLVIIGNAWLGATDESGKHRIDSPRDFVRIEVESALRRNIPIIPLFVQNAKMPSEETLPDSLKELVFRNGMTIGYDPNFHSDIDRLIRRLDGFFAQQQSIEEKTDWPLVFKILGKLVVYDDFYLGYDIPQKVLRNAKERFIPEDEEVIAFADNTIGYSGCDGLAFTTSGIYWRNNHNEEPQALSWMELAEMTIRGSEINDEVQVGSDLVIDLSGSNISAKDLAKILRETTSVISNSS